MLFYEYIPARELIILKRQILTLLGEILIVFKLTASSLDCSRDRISISEFWRSSEPAVHRAALQEQVPSPI